MTYHANQQAPASTSAVAERYHRANTVRDAVAGVLVALGVLLPWNIDFGITIAGTAGWAMALLVLATLLSLGSVLLSHFGATGLRLPDTDLDALNRRRLVLNIPYLVVVLGFLTVAVVQSLRLGGTEAVPPGIGPGAWLGLAGALLAAAPVISGAEDVDRYRGVVRAIGIVSLLLAGVAVLYNLYLRTRFVVPHIGDPDVGVQNLVVAVTALLYGVVAVLPVVVAARWLMSFNPAARLATVLLAASALTAGVLVWVFPVGRDLDAFHGIAQNTSTAGVGFEGYLAWVAAAAILGSAVLAATLNRNSAAVWRAATRKCLVLVAVWCGGSAVLRILDLTSSSVLDLPAPPYNGTALMAFDLVTAVLATWLFINSSGKVGPKTLMALLYGTLFVLTVCRVIVGVALVPRVEPLDPREITDVYGNTLAQQITSTFDVSLCVLTLAMLVIVFTTSVAATKTSPRRRATKTQTVSEAPEGPEASEVVVAADDSSQWARPGAPGADQSPPTVTLPSGQSAHTAAVGRDTAGGAPATARIFRPDSPPGSASPTDRVAEVLAESTRRFAAGTTYGAEATRRPGTAGDTESE